MKHYIAVLVPKLANEWRVYLPDFPGCKATGATPAEAIASSRRNARELVEGKTQHQLPRPRSLGEIQADRDWASKRAVEWEHAIVSLVGIESAR